MIESIKIANVATYGSTTQTLNGLLKINFIFGSNATGKTTISRVIASENEFPACSLVWQRGTILQTLVYNLDFVERNFQEFRGVFTLGEKHQHILQKIGDVKHEIDEITRKIETLIYTLQGVDSIGGKKGELVSLESNFRDKCWAQKQKHDDKLKGAFEGYRASTEKFKSKVIHEWNSNTATLTTLEELEKRAETVFGQTLSTEASISSVNISELIAHESNPILKKHVIGRDDVDIAALIKKLGNSDWVREGRTFYKISDGLCPFCQQSTTEKFAKSLQQYFDDKFETDTKSIDELLTNYNTDSKRIQQQIDDIISTPSRFLDVEKLKSEKTLLDSLITINLQKLVEKKKEPSQIVELDSLSNITTKIRELIDGANSQVTKHNKVVENISQERNTLSDQVWKYLLEYELKEDLASYNKTREDLKKAIDSLEGQITQAKEEKTIKQSELREMERQTTSIQPTIDGINALLSSFGFTNFLLAMADNGTSYKLVRADGSDAKGTLSEGEKSFVTFLYFYHLLKGSDSESGIITDRIVVFDDPVSSLDSDILFIVSSLIKGLFEEVRAEQGNIKQVFVLTHNVYFHKEVTFNARRGNVALCDESFWMVRKPGLYTKLEKCASNPIKTSYELLWLEVKKSDRSSHAIQNTCRRILESYFKILGGFDLDQICELFTGKEKIICKSLCSWVHAGSHQAYDDLYISIDDTTVKTYLRVFREIFVKTNQIAHYDMMMKVAE